MVFLSGKGMAGAPYPPMAFCKSLYFFNMSLKFVPVFSAESQDCGFAAVPASVGVVATLAEK